jgi:hypothetical protein
LVFLLWTSGVHPKPPTFRRCVPGYAMLGWFWRGDGVTHAPNIFPAGYEFEGDRGAIS